MNNQETTSNYLYTVIPGPVMEDHRLEPASKLIFGYIYTTLNAYDKCDIIHTSIYAILGISDSALHDCLGELEMCGYIERHIISEDGHVEHEFVMSPMVNAN